jgi:membrane-bound lytic murein transglycosylase D
MRPADLHPAGRAFLSSLLAVALLAACSGNKAATPSVAEATTPPPEVAEAAPVGIPGTEPDEGFDAVDLDPTIEDLAEEAGDSLPTPDELEVDESETAEEVYDVASALAESLEMYEEADRLWQRGEVEAAYEALDRAYELMASAPRNGDPVLAQEKEDLRQLIADRILKIHRSQLSAAVDLNTEIPMVMNEHVEREIESFQTKEREFFLEAYRRSGLYRPMVVEALREAGMPDQLGWLPMVESWFKVRAYSRAGALGMWQFISSTGYRYGMQRDWWIDTRMDPEKSTGAAIGYLTDLHALFGDWLTALAGYNCGEGNVKRALNRQHDDYLDDFWDIYTRLPRETRRYVPRFLATLHILNEPAKYGFDLPEPLPAQTYEVFEIDRPIELSSVDRLLSLAPGTLEALNPELRRKATPESQYPLKVPPGTAGTLIASLQNVPEWVAPVTYTASYRVRPGDTLSGIASRHGTSVAAIMEMNDLRSANRISQGQTLRVPDSQPSGGEVAASGGRVTYRVRTGDSLWSLAKRHGTTVDRIKRQNGLSSNTLQPGQELTIGEGTVTAAGGTYVVRSGDTLGKIASREHVSLRSLLSANGLTSRSTIFPGQTLVIPR